MSLRPSYAAWDWADVQLHRMKRSNAGEWRSTMAEYSQPSAFVESLGTSAPLGSGTSARSDAQMQQLQQTPRVVRALIDTNVVIDWVLDRKPWSDEAQPLWDARDAGQVVTYLPASVLTDVFYIVRRQAGIPIAFAALDRIFVAFGLFAVDTALLQQ